MVRTRTDRATLADARTLTMARRAGSDMSEPRSTITTPGTGIGRGVGAGFVATAVLSALMALKAGASVMPQLDVIALLAGILQGPRSAGWLVHFLIGTLIWGALFGRLAPVLPTRQHWIKGIVFASGAWLAMMLIVMPLGGAGLFGMRLGPPAPIVTLLLHWIYGAVLGASFGMLQPRRVTLARDLRGRSDAERAFESWGA